MGTPRMGKAAPRRTGFALAAVGAVLALASPSLADDTPWTPTPPTIDPSSIGNTLSGAWTRTATDAWVVGWYTDEDPENGRNMLAERFDGKAWAEVPTPNLARSDEGLLAVSGSSADDAWAVGFTRPDDTLVTRPLAVRWNGTAWATVRTALIGGIPSDASLNGVVSLSPTDAWAVGNRGIPSTNGLIEHWDGKTWSAVPSPTVPRPPGTTLSGVALAGVSAVSPTDIWAVGSYGVITSGGRFQNVTLIEHYDGSAWSVVPSPSPATGDVLNGVAAAGAHDVWAVGQTADSGTGGVVDRTLIEHWDGATWSVVPSPNVRALNDLKGVTASSPIDVWAVGDATDGAGGSPNSVSLTLHWDGAAWKLVPSPIGPAGSTTLNATSAVPGTGTVWAVGATGEAPVNTFAIHQ